EMAAGLAHEIRNPLGAIKGAAQLLVDAESKPLSGMDTPEFISIIVEEVNRLNRVVTQFLDYARPYKSDAAEIDVTAVMKKTVQLLETQEGARDVKLEVKLADALPRIRGDAEQLRQVFLNLSLNALQAMAPDAAPNAAATSTLTISSARRPIRRRGDTGGFV